MARGDKAKKYVAEKLKEVFGSDFQGEQGGKFYLLSPEDGVKIQLAIGLTAPKIPVEFGPPPIDDAPKPELPKYSEPASWDPIIKQKPQPAEISNSERETIADLLKKLNL